MSRKRYGSGDPQVQVPANAREEEALVLPVPRYFPSILMGSMCLAVYFILLAYYWPKLDQQMSTAILVNLIASAAAFFVVVKLIPISAKYLLRKRMFGYDINKKGSPGGSIKVPESLGLVAGIVFIVTAILLQHFCFTLDSEWLLEYNAALSSILFMILLGFADDVLDIPWRIKLLLPAVAAMPLLMAYAGHTTIIVPKPARWFLLGKSILDLGFGYKFLMFLLAIFCTNAINIHAGVNGLEVGQSVVIASAILTHNMIQIGSSSVSEYQQAHAFSIYLMQPMIAVSLGIFAYNWYPSSVFVGDTYTYFAGMAMAVAGILGHFSETLAIFFAPQIINFIYSIPQLFKWRPCPRHRLPTFNPKTGLLTGSNDMNLVNLFLRLFGSTTERKLCMRLLFFQALAAAFCFFLRYSLAGWYK